MTTKFPVWVPMQRKQQGPYYRYVLNDSNSLVGVLYVIKASDLAEREPALLQRLGAVPDPSARIAELEKALAASEKRVKELETPTNYVHHYGESVEDACEVVEFKDVGDTVKAEEWHFLREVNIHKDNDEGDVTITPVSPNQNEVR